MWIVFIIIGAFCGAAVGIYFSSKPSNKDIQKFSKDFKLQQDKVIANLSNKKKQFDKQLDAQYEAQKAAYNFQLEALRKNHNEYLDRLKAREEGLKVQRELQITADIQKENEIKQKEIEQIKEDFDNKRIAIESAIHALKTSYDLKKEELDNSFKDFEEDYLKKKKNYEELLKKQEQHQQEVIARFKEDEARRQEVDFYRIQISENDVEDIKRLKSIAASLNSPQVLYKLIWENYYKSKFSEMVGRVVGTTRGCGIYKITNTINNKVYIGQTKQVYQARWRSHVKRGLKAEPATNNKLYSAMWEDGVENFTFEVICDCPAAALNEKEKYYINFYKSNEWGYNSTVGNS